MNQKSYREFLRDELERRCQRNLRYSLRAFARDLGISAPRLSHVLKGDHGLSRAAAQQITQRMNWNEKESEIFCDLVDAEHSRDQNRKKAALLKVSQYFTQFRTLDSDAFKVISDWYHFAVLELTLVKKFRNNSKWIANALGISVHEAKSAIERLIRLGGLKSVDGTLRLVADFTANPTGVPSESIRKFHKQLLEKAIQAISFQSVDERDYSSLILAVSEQELPEAKECIKKFRRDFNARFSKNKKQKTSVYCLGVQFYRLQERSDV